MLIQIDYGKLGQPGSFLEYPEGVLRICMGNQIEILMLIETLNLAGFDVISANTDGILTYYHESREEEFRKICSEWEESVGNVKLGKLECTKFTEIWQESVNSYIAKKQDGSLKKKGRFVTSYGLPGCEINKNKSARIIPLALEEYIAKGTDPEQFIKNHKSIMDFCIAKKATGKMHYEELDKNGIIKHKKLIRYYISTDGNIFKKRGLNNNGDPIDAYCQAQNSDFPWIDFPKLKYFNKFSEKSNYNIDYDFYILETYKRIDKMQKTKKAASYADRLKPHIQTSLF